MHGAQASISEVGSAEEFTKDSTNGHESREADDAKENGDCGQDAIGAGEEDHFVNDKKGEAEANCKCNSAVFVISFNLILNFLLF